MRFIAILFIAILFSCGDSNNRTPQKAISTSQLENTSFDSLFNRIVNRLGGREKGEFAASIEIESVGKQEFKTIYENPDTYLSNIKKVLANPNSTRIEKLIAIYLYQNVDLKKYVEFTNYGLELVKQGLLSEDVYSYFLIPLGWKTDKRFAENYNDPEVQALFTKIKAIHLFSREVKSYMELISSGKMKESK